MPKQNFKSHAKRKRELAKLDKRTAKDQKRASKRGEPSDTVSVVEPALLPVATGARPGAARGAKGAAHARRSRRALEEHEGSEGETPLLASPGGIELRQRVEFGCRRFTSLARSSHRRRLSTSARRPLCP